VLHGAARLVIERTERLARAVTMEQGKPLAESRIEVKSTAALFNSYAGECQRLYGRELVRPEGLRSTVRHEPVGPVAAFSL
jgi:succinate-semialdehyde dehydrogenase/glutarate-semialdehyde dehydrogenase